MIKDAARTGILLWLWTFFSLAVAQSGLGGPVPAVREELAFAYDETWQLASQAATPNRYMIMEFVRQGDDFRDWKELLTVQNFSHRLDGRTPEDHLNGLKALREQRCPGATTWTVIDKDDASILYEWWAEPCLGWPDQYEIERNILGQFNVYIIHYSKKSTRLDVRERAEWIRRLSEARVVRRM